MNKLLNIIMFILFLIIVIFTKSKLTIFLALPILFLLIKLVDKIKIKNYLIFIFSLSLIIRIITIILLKVPVLDDYKTMLDAALSINNNDLSFLNDFYFKTFSYQLGFTIYESILLKIINSITFLQVINSLITSLIVVMIYLLGKTISNEKSARVVSLLYLLYPYPLYLNSVLTNQHLSILLVLISIYLILTKKELKYYILSGILLGLANIIRPDGIIIILSLIIYLLTFIKKKDFKLKLKQISILVITYLIIITSVSTIINIKYNSNLKNNSPLWKFYVGLNIKNNGMYNEYDQNIFFKSNNQKELLMSRIKTDYKKYPVLFVKKEVIEWSRTNFYIESNMSKITYKIFEILNLTIVFLVLVLFLLELYKSINKKNDKAQLLKIILLIYFITYLFIEVSPRYSYNLHIIIFIIISNSISIIEEYINKIKKLK